MDPQRERPTRAHRRHWQEKRQTFALEATLDKQFTRSDVRSRSAGRRSRATARRTKNIETTGAAAAARDRGSRSIGSKSSVLEASPTHPTSRGASTLEPCVQASDKSGRGGDADAKHGRNHAQRVTRVRLSKLVLEALRGFQYQICSWQAVATGDHGRAEQSRAELSSDAQCRRAEKSGAAQCTTKLEAGPGGR